MVVVVHGVDIEFEVAQLDIATVAELVHHLDIAMGVEIDIEFEVVELDVVMVVDFVELEFVVEYELVADLIVVAVVVAEDWDGQVGS